MAYDLQPSYYTSRWSGEEIDRLLEGGNMVINERVDSLEALKAKYPEGKDGYYVAADTGDVYWWDKSTNEWVSLGHIEGPQGPAGTGIDSIQRTSGTGLAGSTDVYTVYLSDGNEYTFTVVNGRDGNIAEAEAANELAKRLLENTKASAKSAQDAASNAAESARDATDVALHPPILKEGSDHWYIWNTTANDYKDSGIDAGVSLGVSPDTVTGEPGSKAKVENVGTKNDPVLKFTLPEGQPGVSPTVNVQKEGGTTTVTITDAGGEHTAEILDGEVTKAALDSALAKKQDTLTGTQGQVVGFDNAGKAVAAEVGGTNLFPNDVEISIGGEFPTWRFIRSEGNDAATFEKIAIPDSITPCLKNGFRLKNMDGGHFGIETRYINLLVGQTYTLSCYARGGGKLRLQVQGNPMPLKDFDTTDSWKKYSFTYIYNMDLTKHEAARYLIIGNGTLEICGQKLEIGTVATDWSPSPEDLVYKWQTEGVVPHRYVVRWDKKQAKCTRMYDAANITTDTTHFAYHGAVDKSYDNPFDNLYPWSHRKLCKADKAKYKELYEAGGDVMGAITKWEDEPGFKLGPELDGMDMVYTPEFWMKQWEDGGYVYIGVADGPIYGWQYVPEMVLGRYLASDDGNDGLTSLAGDVPLADTVSVGTLHTKAKADHLTLDTIQTWDPETVLMVVEYANMNCQAAIGHSVDSLYRAQSEHPTADGTSVNYVTLPAAMKDWLIPGAILAFGAVNDRGTEARRAVTKTEDVSGGVKVTFSGDPVTYTTATFCSIHGLYNAPDAAIGSKSGYIGTDGRSLAYYRGRNCWGNCFHYLLGAYREQNTGHIWVAPDLETADELDALDKSECIDTGCTLPQGASGAQGEGYIKELYLLPDYPMAPFCKSTGGDSTKPVGDYVWTPALSAGNTICLAGACAGDGLRVGRFTAHWRAASSAAWWGHAASLAFKNPKGGV